MRKNTTSPPDFKPIAASTVDNRIYMREEAAR